ncbi:hypothetical protein chiPu_0019879 [Chiloscyllium punctatum]|uniref:Immunoglobulin domain-containing protein n=1 Tax=Chiloscyllium punctatum TaxID=137246 RepID=A0A401RTD3_CHIPU|nr:hypothetical protein [Chiloscyllium punctatum]
MLHNVSFSDAGTYRCFFNRTFTYRNGEFIFFTQTNKTIKLDVVAKENRKLASIIGEIMIKSQPLEKKLFRKMHQTTWQLHQKAKRIVQGYKWRNNISRSALHLQSLFKHRCWEK